MWRDTAFASWGELQTTDHAQDNTGQEYSYETEQKEKLRVKEERYLL